MRVTLAQISPHLNRKNLAEIVALIESVKVESDIIIFPELSLSGYLLQDKLYEDAYSLDELQILADLSHEIDIVVGVALREADGFRNAALYFANGMLISQHNKVHLPNYGMFEEARYFNAGTIFESFLLRDKRVSMVVCEDLWHKNVHHDLIAQNPDMIVALVASPARGFGDEKLEIEEKWYAIIETVAKECHAKLIFVNRVGFEDGLGFWGGSCILDSDGNITNKLPKFHKKIETFKI